MEVSIVCTLSGVEHLVEVGEEERTTDFLTRVDTLFAFGGRTLDVALHGVALDTTAEYVKDSCALEAGSTLQITPDVSLYVNRLMKGRMKFSDLPLWAQSHRTCILACARAGNLQDLRPYADDKEVVMNAVTTKGLALRYASPALRRDKSIVLAAIHDGGHYAFEFAGPALRRDKEVVLAAAVQGAYCLRFLSSELRSDKEVALAVMSSEGGGARLEDVGAELLGDYDVVMAAVRTWPPSLRYATLALRSNPDIAKAAIAKSPDSIVHASKTLSYNKEVVLAAVSKRGHLLSFACDDLRNDYDVVHAAVSHWKPALSYASEAMQSDARILALHQT